MTRVALNLFSEDLGYQNLEFYEDKNDSGGSAFYIEGIFAQSEIPNGNGRVYPQDILFPTTSQYIEGRVKRGIAMGELDHPEGLTVSLQKVSHLITELRFDGNNVIGKAKITDTPMGKTARGLAESGVKLGVSTRGGGKSKVRKDGIEYMEMYVMTAIDIVSNPSAPDAIVNAYKENVEFFVEEGIITKSAGSKIRKVDTLSNSEFRKLIRNITSF